MKRASLSLVGEARDLAARRESGGAVELVTSRLRQLDNRSAGGPIGDLGKTGEEERCQKREARPPGDQDHTDDVYVQRVDFEGQETQPITVRTKWGYTGAPPQTRAEMLANSQFRDMDVKIFAKQSSAQWVELHQARVARQLLTQ